MADDTQHPEPKLQPDEHLNTEQQGSTTSKGVGYGRPPVEHQFKKGKSGNPKGRPRKKDMTGSEVVARLMRKKIPLKDGELLPIEIAVKATIKEAAGGDMRAVRQLIEFQRIADATKSQSTSLFDPDVAEATLAEHVARVKGDTA